MSDRPCPQCGADHPTGPCPSFLRDLSRETTSCPPGEAPGDAPTSPSPASLDLRPRTRLALRVLLLLPVLWRVRILGTLSPTDRNAALLLMVLAYFGARLVARNLAFRRGEGSSADSAFALLGLVLYGVCLSLLVFCW